MKRKGIMVIIITILLTSYLTFGVSNQVFAKRAISLSPTSQRIILTPGEKFTSGFSIVNPSDADSNLDYLATVGSFSYGQDSNGKADYTTANFDVISEMNAVMNWITIDNPTGSIAPNDSEVLSYTIDVPEDAPAGGQYMTIMVRENPKNAEVSNVSGINEIMQMAFVIYAEVTGETIRSGEILENEFPSFLTDSALEARSLVKNDGNVHTDAEYILQVWPMGSDEEVCTNEEDVSTSLIMPNTERYHTEGCNLSPVGIFRAKQTVKIFGETSIVEKTIIVCPLWLLFIIIFVIFALIFYIMTKVRARKKAKGAKKPENA